MKVRTESGSFGGGLGVGGIFGPIVAGLGIGGGYADSTTTGSTSSWQNASRDYVSNTSQAFHSSLSRQAVSAPQREPHQCATGDGHRDPRGGHEGDHQPQPQPRADDAVLASPPALRGHQLGRRRTARVLRAARARALDDARHAAQCSRPATTRATCCCSATSRCFATTTSSARWSPAIPSCATPSPCCVPSPETRPWCRPARRGRLRR